MHHTIKKRILIFSGLCLVFQLSMAQSYATWDTHQLILDNGIVQRQLIFDPDTGSFTTTNLVVAGGDTSFLSESSDEFSFNVNGILVSGRDSWKMMGIEEASDDLHGSGAKVRLRAEHGPARGMEVELTYLLYPGLPVVRKHITMTNHSQGDLIIENLDVENLEIQGNVPVPWQRDIGSWLLTDYCRNRTIGPYKGNHHDPVIVIHDIDRHRSIALGNESPGVMKRTGVFLDGKSATIGLTYSDEEFPFRKWLAQGDRWTSPKTFIALNENTNDPFQVIDGPVNDFVRRHMGIRLAELDEKPAFVFNTWKPFKWNISADMILELANAAAVCGVEEFVIDYGWSKDMGDWAINTDKFPGGLKPVFDSIKSLGMKPGLWFCLADANNSTDVYKAHPEWFLRDSLGQHFNLHTEESGPGTLTACFGTGWYDHIKSVLLDAVSKYGLEYAKLDLSTVCSAYRYDKMVSGCHAANHPLHRDRPESHLILYQRVWQLFDELHEEAPGLFIDCTFETMGAMQMIDYDMCKHAEGNWLSNFKQSGPLGALRVRHMAWWRSPVIPATALVIGNLEINDPSSELMLMSLAGAFPIMLGDPRQVPQGRRKRLSQWSQWMNAMQDKHNYMMFRQDLPGFGEPEEGKWDGFQRINTDSRSGGVIGVFRHGSMDMQRQVYVKYLDPARNYVVRSGPEGKREGSWIGKELQEKGFTVPLNKRYDGMLFEITAE